MSKSDRLPGTFRSLAALRMLNTIAVGASLAAVTATGFGHIFDARFLSESGAATCVSTFVYGAIWVMLLRWPATVGRTKLRWGWLASIPLAALNAGTACGLSFQHGDFEFPVAFVLGATVGAIIWVPALIATLVCFGAPLAHAQKLAKKGLAGEEIGEEVVGLVSLVISLLAFGLLVTIKDRYEQGDPSETARIIPGAFAFLGLFAGGIAAIIAHLRDAARRRFVRAVEAGSVEGYRVDTSAGGKIIVQSKGAEEGYRVARMELPVCQLADDGEVVRGLEAEGAGQIARTTG